MQIEPFPADVNDRQVELDRRIALGDDVSIALGLIRSLNQDNDCRYNYSGSQLEYLAQFVGGYQTLGVVFTEKMIDDIASGADGAQYPEIGAILDQIHEGTDETGDELPEIDQPFHFDSFPIY